MGALNPRLIYPKTIRNQNFMRIDQSSELSLEYNPFTWQFDDKQTSIITSGNVYCCTFVFLLLQETDLVILLSY